MPKELFIETDFLKNPKTTNREAKNSIFCDLFHMSEYTLQLLQALKQNMQASEKDINYLTLSSVLANDQYNDLSILVKNELIMCIESQSTWSVNILPRMFMYLSETYHRYIRYHNINIYGSKKIFIPRVDCYLIYTGKEDDKSDILSLADEFFLEKSSLNLNLTVYSRKNDDGKNNIIQQYIKFCDIFNEQRNIYGKTITTIEKTIEICIENNILKKYLEAKRMEVNQIMSILFSQEEVMEMYGHECKLDGRKEGITKAITEIVKEFGITTDKAMEILKISNDERNLYKKLLEQKQ